MANVYVIFLGYGAGWDQVLVHGLPQTVPWGVPGRVRVPRGDRGRPGGDLGYLPQVIFSCPSQLGPGEEGNLRYSSSFECFILINSRSEVNIGLPEAVGRDLFGRDGGAEGPQERSTEDLHSCQSGSYGEEDISYVIDGRLGSGSSGGALVQSWTGKDAISLLKGKFC